MEKDNIDVLDGVPNKVEEMGYGGKVFQTFGRDQIEKIKISYKKAISEKDCFKIANMLGISAMLGSVELLKLFIDAGVNVNVYAGNLDSALCLASSSGNSAVVELLLDAGADVNMLCRLDPKYEVEYYQYLNEHGCFNAPSHSEI